MFFYFIDFGYHLFQIPTMEVPSWVSSLSSHDLFRILEQGGVDRSVLDKLKSKYQRSLTTLLFRLLTNNVLKATYQSQ